MLSVNLVQLTIQDMNMPFAHSPQHWLDMVSPVEQTIEVCLPAPAAFGGMTHEQAMQALNNARVIVDKYDAFTTYIKDTSDFLFFDFRAGNDERKRALFHELELAVEGKKDLLNRAIEMFARLKKDELWRPHSRLLRAHEEHSIAAYTRAASLVESIFLTLKAEMSGVNTYSFALKKTEIAMNSGFEQVPESVDSFEDFDKWMMG